MPSGAKKAFNTKLTDTSTTDDEGVGVLRWEGNKCYKWVLYESGAGSVAAASGKVAYYYAASGTSAGDYANHKVTCDLSDSSEIGAGVMQAAVADASYGWMQIKGAATLSVSLTAGADGDPLTATGASDGTLDVTAAATSPIVAFADDASADKIICDFPF